MRKAVAALGQCGASQEAGYFRAIEKGARFLCQSYRRVLEEGLRLERGKGSEGEITKWTPRLRKAVNECKAFNADAPAPLSGSYLIHDKHGSPIKRNAFQSAWGRAQRAWKEKGGERFTFHDLKAAGTSNQKDNYAGHKSEKMRKVYVRKLQLVEPPE